MPQHARKLTLSKQTLRTLNDDELTNVAGGQPTNGVICVDTVVCDSGICGSGVACQSVVCNSAVCNSAVCHTVVCVG